MKETVSERVNIFLTVDAQTITSYFRMDGYWKCRYHGRHKLYWYIMAAIEYHQSCFGHDGAGNGQHKGFTSP